MQDKQYINDKGEVKDIKSLNSFELVNGLSKYSKMLRAFEKEEYTYACKIDQDQCITNVNVLKAELLERLDDRKLKFTEQLDTLDQVAYDDLSDYYKGIKDVLNIINGREDFVITIDLDNIKK